MDYNKHFTDKISNRKIDNDPFFHSYIEEVFPIDFYEKLINKVPDKALFKKTSNKGTIEIQHADILKKVDPFWTKFIHWICSNEVQTLFVESFNVQRGFPHVVIHSHKKNFKLGPHIDKTEKLFTSLFYLPKAPNLLKYGTGMYRPKSSTSKQFNFDDFDLIKKLDFKPNTFFCFKGNNSWHGVEPIREDIERVTMQYLITSEKLGGLYYPA